MSEIGAEIDYDRRVDLAVIYSRILDAASQFNVPISAAANRAIGLGMITRADWDEAMAIVARAALAPAHDGADEGVGT